MYIHIYIYIERERERMGWRQAKKAAAIPGPDGAEWGCGRRVQLSGSICIYIHVVVVVVVVVVVLDGSSPGAEELGQSDEPLSPSPLSPRTSK